MLTHIKKNKNCEEDADTRIVNCNTQINLKKTNMRNTKTITLMIVCFCAALLTTGLQTEEEKHMDENQLCQKLEDCYKSIKWAKGEKGQVLDTHVERLSYLVLVAGTYSSGSKRLDAVLTTIQKESPMLVVPRFVMTPAKLEKFIHDMAINDPNDYAYSAYLRKLRYMSEWIAWAKEEITARSGFKSDPSVSVIHSQ